MSTPTPSKLVLPSLFAAGLIVLGSAIGILSQNAREAVSSVLMVALMIWHFRTRRTTRDGGKFGTPESTAFVAMALGVCLIGAAIFAWGYAMEKGGLWWLLLGAVGLTCLSAGNSVKESLEGAVRDSRKEQNEANQPPQRNAGSRPSSGDSPASETPSSLGPRG